MKELLNEIISTPLLTQEEEIQLSEKIKKGGPEKNVAMEKMVKANIRLVMSIANNFKDCGIPVEDLIQEGSIGLMRAAEKFEGDKGFRFSTYASWWIRQAITRYVSDRGRMVRLPVHMIEQIKEYNRTVTYLKQKLKRIPEDKEVAEKLGWSMEKLQKTRSSIVSTVFMEDAVSDDEELTVGDTVDDKLNPSPHEEVCTNMIREQLLADIDSYLTEREKEVVKMRFGFDDGCGQTLEEIGDRLGVTRERVRQIESRAICKLRAQFRKRGAEYSDYFNESA